MCTNNNCLMPLIKQLPCADNIVSIAEGQHFNKPFDKPKQREQILNSDLVVIYDPIADHELVRKINKDVPIIMRFEKTNTYPQFILDNDYDGSTYFVYGKYRENQHVGKFDDISDDDKNRICDIMTEYHETKNAT